MFGQQTISTNTIVKEIDPASVDLSKPTLFIAPYSHLDDIWRWSYPQVIRDFLKNTLDENFSAFEKYPNFVFNWSGASRYAMMRSIIRNDISCLKNGFLKDAGFPAEVLGWKTIRIYHLRNQL